MNTFLIVFTIGASTYLAVRSFANGSPLLAFIAVLLGGLIVCGLTACTASPTSPQPVCREYGFSPTSGRDTVYIVPCGQQAREAQNKEKK